MFYAFLYPKGKNVTSRALPFTLVELGTEMGILSGLFFLTSFWRLEWHKLCRSGLKSVS